MTPTRDALGYGKCPTCPLWNVLPGEDGPCHSCRTEYRQREEIRLNGGNTPLNFKQWYPLESLVEIDPIKFTELQDPIVSALSQ